jgi:hypothetical protein
MHDLCVCLLRKGGGEHDSKNVGCGQETEIKIVVALVVAIASRSVFILRCHISHVSKRRSTRLSFLECGSLARENSSNFGSDSWIDVFFSC